MADGCQKLKIIMKQNVISQFLAFENVLDLHRKKVIRKILLYKRLV